MNELFTGTGIAHSIMLFAVVIAAGLYLGRFKVKGVSIGSTWILFLAILVSHLGLRVAPTVLAFMKDFGLIAGSTTDPAVLAFAQGAYGTDYTSINYATVYPLSMFLRVFVAQLLILFSL